MDIEDLENQVRKLRIKLEEKEDELNDLKLRYCHAVCNATKLTNFEISRYSRQIILPEVQVKGQLDFKNAKVLIVGAGGLGCPAALYLAGAGIGHIGLVDYDYVDLNNLHRQLLHQEPNIGQPKVESASRHLRRMNCDLRVTPYHLQLDSSNALGIIGMYDIVVDATDNVPTRYLLNDACVFTGRPLVSGSALRLEGQMTVYNYKNGPCLRCVFPVPPPPETVTNCGDGGVLGVIPGVIGTLQALEVIKIIIGNCNVVYNHLLMFDGTDTRFYRIQLAGKNPLCDVCGEDPKINALVDYEQFCGAKANDKNASVHLLADSERISAVDYYVIRNKELPHLLIDVRPPVEFGICRIDGSLNYPLTTLYGPTLVELKRLIEERCSGNTFFPVFIICRRGNDSQKAALKLKECLSETGIMLKDIKGGLDSWANDVDTHFPIY